MGRKELIQEQLLKKIAENLSFIEKMSFLEQYAIFMGKAQLVELELSGLLIRKYNYDEEEIGKYTLGKIIGELQKHKLRPDFVELLKELLKYRNSLAHEFLGVTAMGNKLDGGDFEKLQYKELRYALVKVEEVVHVYDFLSENEML